jgi:addiction module RelB/DinJ family antitoxin
MSKTAVLQTRITPKQKKELEQFVSKDGFTVSDAISMYVNKIIKNKGIPFDFLIDDSEKIYLTEEEEKELEISINSGWATDEEVKAVFGRTFN